jgi:hypothetical protein
VGNTIARKFAPLSIAGLSVVLITGCGGASKPPPRPVPGAKLATAVFALSEAQNLTVVRTYLPGVPVGISIIDTSRRLDTQTGSTTAPASAIRIGNSVYVLLAGGGTGTGASCYLKRTLPWNRLRRFALSSGLTVTAVHRHTIDFTTVDGRLRIHGWFHFSDANLIVGEHASARVGNQLIRNSWSYSYPATPPAELVSSPPKNLCSNI